jgi:AraC-like DNA-binding protein
MIDAIRYWKTAPPAALGRHVQCAWRLQAPAEPGHIDTIYPDGHCELIMQIGTPPFVRSAGRDWERQSDCLFSGQLRYAIQLKSDEALDCLGIRLQPAASAALARPLLADLRDRVVNLEEVDADFAHAIRSTMTQSSEPEPLRSLWRLLGSRLLHEPLDTIVEQTVQRIQELDGQCQVAQLARECDISIRGLQTRFLNAVGLSPKEYARIMRLQATLKGLDEGTQSLSQLAVSTGFADQAHASREVRRVTGLTPLRLRDALRAQRDDDHTLQMAAAFIRGGR